MRNILLITFLSFTAMLFSASQVPDVFIIKDKAQVDTLQLQVFPLEELFETLGDRNLPGFHICESPDCNRGYQAIWVVENDSLFLQSIQGCNAQMSWCDETNADLKLMFPDKFKNGRVHANWVKGKLFPTEGDAIPFFLTPVYKGIAKVAVKEGEIKRLKQYDNIEERENAMDVNEQTNNKLIEYIYTTLDWQSIPTKKMFTADMIITVKKNGKSTVRLNNCKLKDDDIAVIIDLLENTLEGLQWNKYKNLGKKIEVSFMIPILMDKSSKVITVYKPK